jgi:hypothetical protein
MDKLHPSVSYYDFFLNNDNDSIMKGIGKMRISIYGMYLMNQK